MKEYISRSLGHNRSSLLSSKGFSATAETAACTDSHRQHVCGFVYKSSRRVKIAPRVGTDDLEPLALRESGGGSVRQEREHPLPVVLHSPLTSRWPAARPYAFPPIKKCCRWCYERSGWSEHQWYSSPRTSLGSQTWRNCWRRLKLISACCCKLVFIITFIWVRHFIRCVRLIIHKPTQTQDTSRFQNKRPNTRSEFTCFDVHMFI